MSYELAQAADQAIVAPYIRLGLYLPGISTTNSATANTAALKAAIAAGGEIILPPGTIDLDGSQFSWGGALRLIGDGSGTRLRRTVASVSGAWQNFDNTSLYMRNIIIDGNGQGGDVWNALIGANCLDIDVEESQFTGGIGSNLGYGCTVLGTQDSLGVDQDTRRRIVNCRFNGNAKSGLWVQHGQNFEIEGNTANGNTENGITVDFNDAALLRQVRRGSAIGNRCKGNGSSGLTIGNPNKTNLNGSGTRWGAGNPDAHSFAVQANHCWENTAYGLVICGEDILAKGNTAEKNDSAAMLAVGNRLTIEGNALEGLRQSGADCSWTIDCGQITESVVRGNTINRGSTGLNIGASQNSLYEGNILTDQSYAAISGSPVDTDGSGVAFQGTGSNITLRGNQIGLKSGARGIYVTDGFPNVNVESNNFWVTDGSSVTAAQALAIQVHSPSGGAHVKGNTWNGLSWGSISISANALVLPDLFDEFINADSTPTVNSLKPQSYVSMEGKIAWCNLTAAGSGYTSAPAVGFSGGGGTGAAATAYIDQGGAVVGIRMSNFGSGYTSAPSVSLTGGGGSGATATAQFQIPMHRRTVVIHFLNGANLTSGAFPAFSVPGDGGNVGSGQVAVIDQLYSTNYLRGGTGHSRVRLVEGISAPSTPSGSTDVYIDSADNSQKTKYSDGTVRRLSQKAAVYAAVATDASFTLTPGTSQVYTKHTGTLTADRTITLSTTNAVQGDRFVVFRTGSGAFNLIVGGLKNLATGQWCEVVYDGSAWQLAAFGSL
jgi:parallel beta-helix repeat protein